MKRTRLTQWDLDPGDQSKKHYVVKEITKIRGRRIQVLKATNSDLYMLNCWDGDSVNQFPVNEIMKQDWRFCDPNVYAQINQDMRNISSNEDFSRSIRWLFVESHYEEVRANI